jgi:hypothetical protein
MRVIVIFSRICSRIARIDFRNLQESSASGIVKGGLLEIHHLQIETSMIIPKSH